MRGGGRGLPDQRWRTRKSRTGGADSRKRRSWQPRPRPPRPRWKRQLAANEKALEGKEAQIAQLEKEEAARQAQAGRRSQSQGRGGARRRRRPRKRPRRPPRPRRPQPASQAGLEAAPTQRQRLGARLGQQQRRGLHSHEVSGLSVRVGGRQSRTASTARASSCTCTRRWASACLIPAACSTAAAWPVSRGDLQPGDLVFFYSPIHHVGIYIGDGKMIHAAGTGKDVRIDSVWTQQLLRRLPHHPLEPSRHGPSRPSTTTRCSSSTRRVSIPRTRSVSSSPGRLCWRAGSTWSGSRPSRRRSRR